MQKIELLYTEVETLRAILHDRIKIYQDFTHPHIVELSQEIDHLLNEIDQEKQSALLLNLRDYEDS